MMLAITRSTFLMFSFDPGCTATNSDIRMHGRDFTTFGRFRLRDQSPKFVSQRSFPIRGLTRT